METFTLSLNNDDSKRSYSKEFDDSVINCEEFFNTVLEFYSQLGYVNDVEIIVSGRFMGDTTLTYTRDNYINVYKQ